MKFMRLLLTVLLLPVLTAAALARVDITINLSTQRMTVTVDGRHYATWRVSTGRRGYFTPRGNYRPQWMKRMHYSRKYDNAPMPYSIFFRGGFAIHGTNVISRLGRPASHGCVRLHPSNAAELFRLVREHGMGNTRIHIIGSTAVAYANLPPLRTVRHRKRRWSAAKGRKLASARRVAKRRSEVRRTRGRKMEFLQIFGAGY